MGASINGGTYSSLDQYEALLRERDYLKDEIVKLADFILKEVPGEPSQREGAVDTAIRVIREFQTGERESNANEISPDLDSKLGEIASEDLR